MLTAIYFWSRNYSQELIVHECRIARQSVIEICHLLREVRDDMSLETVLFGYYAGASKLIEKILIPVLVLMFACTQIDVSSDNLLVMISQAKQTSRKFKSGG